MGEVAELPEGVTDWLLCVRTVSIGRRARIRWTSQEGRDIYYFNLTSPKDALRDREFNSTVAGLCKNHGNVTGMVLVVGIPEEVIHSEQHDGAYLSFQRSLLVFCGAQRYMSGIYTCGDNSAQVRRVHVCIGSCSPHASLTPQPHPLNEKIGAATISLIVLLYIAVVSCVVSVVLTSVVFWGQRKKKAALNNLQQIQLVHSTGLTIDNHHSAQD